MSKGRTVDTTGKIDPALLPVLESSSRNIIESARRNPVTGFQESYPKQVAPLSDYQRFAGSRITGLTSPTTGDTLALQAISRAVGMAGRGPTVGENVESPNLSTVRNALNPYGGQWIPGTPSGNIGYQSSPRLGPPQLSPEEPPPRRPPKYWDPEDPSNQIKQP